MWDKHYIGKDLTGFSNNGLLHEITKVTLIIDDDNSVSAGNNVGIEIQAECPYATREMANNLLLALKGYRYQTYTADKANLDPAAELGDGATVSGVYSVISQITDGGDGYPGIAAPGESELQEEYPIIGPATQEFNRKIESVKKWVQENDEDIRQAVDSATQQITGNLGGYVVLHSSSGGKNPDEILVMDAPTVDTAKNIWRWNKSGLGHSTNGYRGPYGTAITQDGAIVADYITAGFLRAALIKTGRIQGLKANGPYFDLDANGGKGELAASVLRGVEDGTTTTARIGVGTYAGGETYEGMKIHTTSGSGGDILLAIEREKGDYTLSNKAEISASGNLKIRSQTIASNPGGNNGIDMLGNSTTGEGTVRIYRGTHSGTETLFYGDFEQSCVNYKNNAILFGDSANSHVSFKNKDILWGDSTHTAVSFDGKNIVESNASNIWLRYGGQTVFHGGSDNSNVSFKNHDILWGDSSHTTVSFNGNNVLSANRSETDLFFKSGDNYNRVSVGSTKIEFAIGDHAVASIESRGSYFGDLYTNGVKVTSDRRKKENISVLKDSALDMVRKAKVYGYTLKETGNKHTGIMYDEAPECIRSEGKEKAVDLYGMVSLLWKAVQELEKKIDSIAKGE